MNAFGRFVLSLNVASVSTSDLMVHKRPFLFVILRNVIYLNYDIYPKILNKETIEKAKYRDVWILIPTSSEKFT